MNAPILNVFTYHRVLPAAADNTVPVELFRRQLGYLANRYRVLNGSELLSFLRGHLAPDRPCAALTFDDGWRDNWTTASPILAEFGLPAILALSTAVLESGETVYLSGDDVRAMAQSGAWSIQAHGHRHERMTGPAQTRNSLAECRRIIEQLTGRAPDFLFWPWGVYSDPALNVARDAGFQFTFSTEKGIIRPGDRRPVLPRIGVGPSWPKFLRNAILFRNPILAAAHGWVSPSKPGRVQTA